MMRDQAHETSLERARHEVTDLLDINRGLEVEMEDRDDEATEVRNQLRVVTEERDRLLTHLRELEASHGDDPLTGMPPGG